MTPPRKSYFLAAELLDDVRGRARTIRTEIEADIARVGVVVFNERNEPPRPLFDETATDGIAAALDSITLGHRNELIDRVVMPGWIVQWQRKLLETIGRVVVHRRKPPENHTAHPIFDSLGEVAGQIRRSLDYHEQTGRQG